MPGGRGFAIEGCSEAAALDSTASPAVASAGDDGREKTGEE